MHIRPHSISRPLGRADAPRRLHDRHGALRRHRRRAQRQATERRFASAPHSPGARVQSPASDAPERGIYREAALPPASMFKLPYAADYLPCPHRAFPGVRPSPGAATTKPAKLPIFLKCASGQERPSGRFFDLGNTPPRTRPNSSGFSLVELLVIIGVLAVLAGIIFPMLSRAGVQAKTRAAKTEMKNLEAAIVAFDAAYGRFPAKATGAADLTFGYANGVTGIPANSEIMIILMDLNTGENINHALNPDRLSTFTPRQVCDTSSPGLSTQDHQLRDPWGRPYVITMDLDGDKRCRDAFYSTSISRVQPGQAQGLNGLTDNGNGYFELNSPVMIWSAGPDGRYDDAPGAKANAGANKDNLLSWQ
jgi:type II secretory pathway pseudopilin PulG